MDQNIRPLLEKKFLQGKRKLNNKNSFKTYLNLQIAFSIIVLCWVTLNFDQLNAYSKTCTVTIILITLINCGALLEQRRWIYYLEYFRVLIVLLWVSIEISSFEFLITTAISLFILEYALPLNKWYTQYILKLPKTTSSHTAGASANARTFPSLPFINSDSNKAHNTL